MKHMIEEPAIGEVMAIERKMRGERLELFQGALDVLHDRKLAQDNPDIAWRLSNLPYLLRGFERVNRESRDNCARPAGVLYARLKTPAHTIDLGLASVNVVTTAGVNYVIDSLQALATINNLRWHASGTNNTAENAGLRVIKEIEDEEEKVRAEWEEAGEKNDTRKKYEILKRDFGGGD